MPSVEELDLCAKGGKNLTEILLVLVILLNAKY